MNDSDTTLKVEGVIHFDRRGKGARKELCLGPAPTDPEPGRVPRVARLMALAIRFDQLIRDRAVADYAELARLGRVSRARVTQVMNLTLLAPDIQEEILFLPRVGVGRATVLLRDLQPVAACTDWAKQRRLWNKVRTAPAGA